MRLRTEPNAATGQRIWIGAATLLALGVLWALKSTWLRWGDPILDTGREVGIAQRLAEGAVLYRDLAFNYGPFTAYWNAAFFGFFGPSMGTLLVINFVNLTLAVLALIFLLRRLLAPTLVVVLLGVFFLESVFQHYYINGTFSFLMPYSFSAVQASIASLFTLGLLLRFLERREDTDLRGASLGVGLVALCKIEVALAAGMALTAVLFLSRREPSGASLRRTVADAVFPGLLTVLVGIVPFLVLAGPDVVLRDNLFRLVVDRPRGFFDRVLGISDLASSIKAVLSSAAYWVVFLGAAASTTRRWAGRTRSARRAPTWGIVIGALGGAGAVLLFDPFTVFRGLPILYLAFAVYITVQLRRRFVVDLARDLVIALFVLALLLRIAFNTGTFHYGFFLALPAVVLLPAVVPALFAGSGRDRDASQAGSWVTASCLLTISLAHFVTVSLPAWRLVTAEMAGRRGTIRVLPTPVNYYLAASLPQLTATIPEHSTLTVFPEGAMVGFLLGCSSPAKYLLMTPPEVTGRESEVLEDLRAHPAEYLLLVNRDVSDYASAGPGVDYGIEIMRYFAAEYDTISGAGPLPYRGEPGGWLLFRRKNLLTSPPRDRVDPG